ncbi:hypothetical protein IJ818_05100 [bacterium]|nr:hypothetical protein [bacterium]
MGMAASQARYLGLAARKTNCEYMGQQINQARTALANQSAELWNQMLGMSVPVVPDQTNFAKTQYSFSDGQNAFEIVSMVPSDENDEYNYTVKYQYYEDEIKGVEVANTNPQVQNAETHTETEYTHDGPSSQAVTETSGSFYTTYGGSSEELTEITDATELATARTLLTNNGITVGNKIYKTASGVYYTGDEITAAGNYNLYKNFDTEDVTVADSFKVGNATATAVKLADVNKDPNLAATLLKIAEDNPDTKIASAISSAYTSSTKTWNNNISEVYTFQKNGTTYFATKTELEESRDSFAEDNGTEVSYIDKQDFLKQYYTTQVKTTKTQTDRALMDDASGTGRYSSIKLSKYSTSFNLNTESTTNEEAYEQAMNQYYYDNQVYNKKIADINAKTSVIQQEDRTLELRLKQLDTEHNALQTEMEAVKKVISKNVEDTFKTFNG